MASRTQNYGTARESIAMRSSSNAVFTDTTARLNVSTQLEPALGGTGINTAASTGVAKVLAGNWSVDYINGADFGLPYSNAYVLSINTGNVLAWVPKANIAPDPVTQVNTLVYNTTNLDYDLAVDTSIGAITINLPQTTIGKRFNIIDVAGYAGNNYITIVPYVGNTILRSTAPLVVPYSNSSVGIVGVSSTNWHIVTQN